MQNLLSLLQLSENLKMELRHNWLSNGRQESVAEHTWRMSLMAILLAPRLTHKVDLGQVLSMVIIHDLPEVKTGDIAHAEDLTTQQLSQKFTQEQSAMAELSTLAGKPLSDDLIHLWENFESSDSWEARFVRALDKLEVFLQHIEGGITHWNEKEYALFQNKSWLDAYCQHEPALMEFVALLFEQVDQLVLRAKKRA